MFLEGLFLLILLSLIGSSLSDLDTLGSLVSFASFTHAVALLSWETGRLKCRGLGSGGEDDPVSSEVSLILEVGSGGGGEMGVSVNSLLGGGYTMYLSCFLVLPFSCCKTTKASLFTGRIATALGF